MTETIIVPTRSVSDVLEDLHTDSVLRDAVPPPTCEVHLGANLDAPICGRPAAWLCSASCGHSAYYCDRCRLSHEARTANPGRGLCPHHGARAARVTIVWIQL